MVLTLELKYRAGPKQMRVRGLPQKKQKKHKITLTAQYISASLEDVDFRMYGMYGVYG